MSAGPSSVSTRKAVTYGAMPLIALATTVALETGERQSLAQAVDGIQDTFGVSDTWLGLIPAAMTIVGVIGAFPFGVLADRMRRTALLAIGLTAWTVCMGLSALAPTFALLFLTRIGVGMVEANGPAAVSLLADYYPASERARRMSLYQGGALFGAMIGIGLGGVVVDAGGWRWGFAMWVPLGALAAVFILRQPEPERGHHDATFLVEAELSPAGLDASAVSAGIVLPAPRRVGTLDYAVAGAREVFAELRRIPSMWFAVLGLTVSQLLLNALQFWGIEYFKRVHELSAAKAGGVASLLGLGSGIGIVAGGFLSDRYLRRGHLNARVLVCAVGSVAATVVLIPAFLGTSLAISAPLYVVGGFFLTLPVGPAEAMVTDVVVHQLRGRAATVRSVVRALSALGPVLIGVLSQALGGGADGLRYAIVALCPLYAIGGVVMLLATRHYAHDVAFVVAEARRTGRAEPDEPGNLT